MSETISQFRDWDAEIEHPAKPITEDQMKLFVRRCEELAAAAEVAEEDREFFEAATQFEVFDQKVFIDIRKGDDFFRADGEISSTPLSAVVWVNLFDTLDNQNYRVDRTTLQRFIVGFARDDEGHPIQLEAGTLKSERLINFDSAEDIKPDFTLMEHDEEGSLQIDWEALESINAASVNAGEYAFSQGHFVEVMRLLDLVQVQRDLGEFNTVSEKDPEPEPESLSPEQVRFFCERIEELTAEGHNNRVIHRLGKILFFLDSNEDWHVITGRVDMEVPGSPDLRVKLGRTFHIDSVVKLARWHIGVIDRRTNEPVPDDVIEAALKRAVEVNPEFQSQVDRLNEIWAEENSFGANQFGPNEFNEVMKTLYELGPGTVEQEMTDKLP